LTSNPNAIGFIVLYGLIGLLYIIESLKSSFINLIRKFL